VHEVQAEHRSDFARRMFEYYAVLRLHYRLPVFPIVLYLRSGAPQRADAASPSSAIGPPSNPSLPELAEQRPPLHNWGYARTPPQRAPSQPQPNAFHPGETAIDRSFRLHKHRERGRQRVW
jgi:hypothetical protein